MTTTDTIWVKTIRPMSQEELIFGFDPGDDTNFVILPGQRARVVWLGDKEVIVYFGNIIWLPDGFHVRKATIKLENLELI